MYICFRRHPFTISSAYHEGFIGIHMRIVGDWTGKVYKLLNPVSFHFLPFFSFFSIFWHFILRERNWDWCNRTWSLHPTENRSSSLTVPLVLLPIRSVFSSLRFLLGDFLTCWSCRCSIMIRWCCSRVVLVSLHLLPSSNPSNMKSSRGRASTIPCL